MLGLSRDVTAEALTALTLNCHPLHPGRQLTARMKKNQRVGYDFTFNAPKGASLLYGMTGDDRIKAVFEKAIRDTLRDIEKDMRARVRKGTVRDRIQPNVHESLTYGMAKLFQTHSVMDGRALMTEAMRYGVGFVSPEDAEAYRNMPGVMTVEEGERVLVTTRDVLAEETKMLNY